MKVLKAIVTLLITIACALVMMFVYMKGIEFIEFTVWPFLDKGCARAWKYVYEAWYRWRTRGQTAELHRMYQL